jgi:hypothetical protein
MLFIRSRERRELAEFFFEDVGCFVPLLVFILFIALLAALARALSRIHPENRRIEPAQVWLNLVPFFNLIWLPVTVDRVGDSLRNELIDRGQEKKRDGYAKSAGFTGLLLVWIGFFMPYPVGFLLWAFALVYAVVYWMLVNGYARRLDDPETQPQPPDEGW